MPLLEKPKNKGETLRGKEVAEDLKAFAERHGIDLSTADLEETKKILKKLPCSLSDEIRRLEKLAIEKNIP